LLCSLCCATLSVLVLGHVDFSEPARTRYCELLPLGGYLQHSFSGFSTTRTAPGTLISPGRYSSFETARRHTSNQMNVHPQNISRHFAWGDVLMTIGRMIVERQKSRGISPRAMFGEW
jgi:hypothetical protein